MLFQLSFEFGEGGFASGGEMLAFFRGVQRGRGKNEIQREAKLFGPRKNGENTMKLNEIGIIVS